MKLLTFEPTGAIIAAPHHELAGSHRPQSAIGIIATTWFRDAAFTVYAMVRIGFKQEATAFISWMHHYASKHLNKEHEGVVFTIDGTEQLREFTLDHWEGYRGSGPVRIGNGAVVQYQGDIYGEIMDALYLANKYVSPTPYDAWLRIRSLLDWICDNWQRAGFRHLGDAQSAGEFRLFRR